MVYGILEELINRAKEKEIQWRIPNFSKLGNCFEDSPKFNFLDAIWILKLDTSENNKGDHIALEVKVLEVGIVSYNVLTTLSIKKACGSRIGATCFHHSYCKMKKRINASHFFSRATLARYQSELLPSDELTVICNLKHLADKIKLLGNIKFNPRTNLFLKK